MIIPAVVDLLKAQSAVTSLVADRISTALQQNGNFPAIEIRQSAGGNTGQTLQGDKPAFISYLTLDCYSNSGHGPADQVAASLYAKAILSYRGVRKGVFIHGITASGSPTHDNETVDPAGSDSGRRYITTVDYEVVWSLA